MTEHCAVCGTAIDLEASHVAIVENMERETYGPIQREGVTGAVVRPSEISVPTFDVDHSEGLLLLCMDEACRDQIHEALRPWLCDHPILKKKD